MKLYRITLLPEGTAVYRATRDLARHKVADWAMRTGMVSDARVERIEINPSADDIVDMLNGVYTFARTVSPTQTWCLSRRGGLIEVANGE